MPPTQATQARENRERDEQGQDPDEPDQHDQRFQDNRQYRDHPGRQAVDIGDIADRRRLAAKPEPPGRPGPGIGKRPDGAAEPGQHRIDQNEGTEGQRRPEGDTDQ